MPGAGTPGAVITIKFSFSRNEPGNLQFLHKHMEEFISEAKEAAWYAIYSRSRHESKVESGLTTKGFINFLPKITVPSRRRDRRQMISVPLFPSYIFVNSKLTPSHYHQIIKIPGVVQILGTRGHFIPVPGTIIKSLQAVVNSGRSYYPWQYLTEGDQVQILDGPLTGVVGKILRRNDAKHRLVVSIDLMGRSVAVDLENDLVEPWSP